MLLTAWGLGARKRVRGGRMVVSEDSGYGAWRCRWWPPAVLHPHFHTSHIEFLFWQTIQLAYLAPAASSLASFIHFLLSSSQGSERRSDVTVWYLLCRDVVGLLLAPGQGKNERRTWIMARTEGAIWWALCDVHGLLPATLMGTKHLERVGGVHLKRPSRALQQIVLHRAMISSPKT